MVPCPIKVLRRGHHMPCPIRKVGLIKVVGLVKSPNKTKQVGIASDRMLFLIAVRNEKKGEL